MLTAASEGSDADNPLQLRHGMVRVFREYH